jgi:hypothetical protein
MPHRNLQTGETVKVYRNLHKKCFSVQDSFGRVVAHVNDLHLVDCTFIVRQGGRRKVLETGRKNVHAFIKGKVTLSPELSYPLKVRYNPYQSDSFEADGIPIYEASAVSIGSDGIWMEL